MEDKDFLSYFAELRQYSNKELKIAAVKKIVQTLLTVENIKKTGNRKLSGDPISMESMIIKKYKNEDFGVGVGADLNYTLSRLIKGLATDNNAAKEGFYIAFLQVITVFSVVNPIALLKIIIKETTTIQGVSKKELKNIRASRVFLFSAVLQTGILSRGNIKEGVEIILKSLFELYQKNDYLQPMIYKVIQSILDLYKGQTAVLELTQKILEAEVKPGEGKGKKILNSHIHNSHDLLLGLLYKRTSELLEKKCTTKFARSEKIPEIKQLFSSFTEISKDSIPVPLSEYIKYLLSAKKGPVLLHQIWEKIVLREQENLNIQKVAFAILSQMFGAYPSIDSSVLNLLVEKMLTKEFISSWAELMHQASAKSATRALAEQAELSFCQYGESIKGKVAEEEVSNFALNMLKKIFGYNPQHFFTPTRHSKLYKELVDLLPSKYIGLYCNYLRKNFEEDKDSQIYAISQLTSLLTLSHRKIEDSQAKENMQFLMQKILIEEDKKRKQQQLQSLFSMIGVLNKTAHRQDDVFARGVDSKGKLWIMTFHEIVDSLAKSHKKLKESPLEICRNKALKFSAQIRELRTKIESILKDLKIPRKTSESLEEPPKKKRKSSEANEELLLIEKKNKLF